MKNAPFIVFAVAIVAAAFYLMGMPQAPKTSTIPTPTVTTASTDSATNIKTVDVKGLNFSFDVKEIKVKKGDTVKVNFTNTEGFHDFKIDEFNVATKQIKAGESETVSFVADKIGTFEYYCSVGKHRQMGMVGKLVVEE